MMNGEISELLAFMLLAGGVLAVMLSIAFRRSQRLASGLCLAFLVAALASLYVVGTPDHTIIEGLLVMDQQARYFVGLLIFAAIVTGIFSAIFSQRDKDLPEEFYCLLLLATLGASVLAASVHAATLLLGLEMLSISLYAMIAYARTRKSALEAAVKYLVLAATSSAFLIFGIALLYAASGSLEVSQWVLAPRGEAVPLLVPCLTLGAVFVMVGAGFKLALVPFHLWTPDVYQASPEPVAAFIATASKGAMIAFLLRLAVVTGSFTNHGLLMLAVSVVAVLSMLAGNLLALLQSNLKRLLAYSSIAHMGYLLVAIRAAGTGTSSGAVAASYYLAAYFPAMLAAFGVLAMLRQATGREVVTVTDLNGLASERPFCTGVLTVAMLSLAGLPLTSGFMGKLYLVISGVDVNAWGLVAALVVGTAIGIFFYLRVIIAMFAPRSSAAAVSVPNSDHRRVPTLNATASMAVLVVIIVWLGVEPFSLLRLLGASTPFHP